MLSENTKAKLEIYYKLKLNRIPFNLAMLQVNKEGLLEAGITEEEIVLLEEYTRFSKEVQTAFVQMMKSKPIPFDKTINSKYTRYQETLEMYEKEGKLKNWLVNYTNNYLEPVKPLTIEDIESLQLITESIPLKELRQDYGNPYIRPFLMLKLQDYQKFYEKLTGRGGSWGCCISGDAVNKNELTAGLQIIISPGLREQVYHELRHSIDPYMHRRKKEDAVIEEFIGYYGDIVRPTTIIQTTTYAGAGGKKITETKETRKPKNIGYIRSLLKREMYHSQICPEIFFGEYCAVVDNIAKILEGMQAYFTNEEIDRILYGCKTIDDLKRVYLVVSIQGKI